VNVLWLIPVVLGVVEGLTEFLPVSSTGHLILAGYALGFTGDFAKTFEIAIQLGAILAVVVYFRSSLADLARRCVTHDAIARGFVTAVGIAFLPAAVVGLLAHRAITTYLFTPQTVGVTLIVGGAAILMIEATHRRLTVTNIEAVNIRTALWVGLAQCLSLIPGISRAGATIMGGLLVGMDRKTATEFSFFLALPTMFAATVYEAYKGRALLVEGNVLELGIGLITAFLSALIVIDFFLTFVQRHTFRIFAYYRILLGLFVLALFWSV